MELIEENADVLRSLRHDPAGPAAPRLVNFTLVFPNDEVRAEGLALVSGMGFDCKLSNESVSPAESEATATKNLAPTAAAITEAEQALNDCLDAIGGRTDGWGFWHETIH